MKGKILNFQNLYKIVLQEPPFSFQGKFKEIFWQTIMSGSKLWPKILSRQSWCLRYWWPLGTQRSMRVPRLVFPRNLKGPLICPPHWSKHRGCLSSTRQLCLCFLGKRLPCDFPVSQQPLWLFWAASAGLGQITCSLLFLLSKSRGQGTSYPQHFPSKRLSLLLSRPGGKITPDTSCEGSDPGIATKGQQVPALRVCSEAGLEDPDEVDMTSLNPWGYI